VRRTSRRTQLNRCFSSRLAKPRCDTNWAPANPVRSKRFLDEVQNVLKWVRWTIFLGEPLISMLDMPDTALPKLPKHLKPFGGCISQMRYPRLPIPIQPRFRVRIVDECFRNRDKRAGMTTPSAFLGSLPNRGDIPAFIVALLGTGLRLSVAERRF